MAMKEVCAWDCIFISNIYIFKYTKQFNNCNWICFQIRFQPNDHQTIKETADELKIFEGIKHPNLVRYFGVELHRVKICVFVLCQGLFISSVLLFLIVPRSLLQEEMYIFMEYCDEGTLEEVSRLGLQEHVIRLYSKQITTAINVLHEHGIVHRDIKGVLLLLHLLQDFHFLSSFFLHQNDRCLWDADVQNDTFIIR